MAGNIIPAIATTNAMAAGLCVLQALKVMREEYDKARMVFLVRSTDRVISSETLRPPKLDCPVCGVSQARIEVDLNRATLDDLVTVVLRNQLGYGEEFSVNSEVGVLFDPDLEDNLEKKLTDLSIETDSFLTIIDDDEKDPRVNLLLSVVKKDLVADSPPIRLVDKIEIVRKAKGTWLAALDDAVLPKATNGHTNGSNAKRKRDAEEADLEAGIIAKRGKVVEGSGIRTDAIDNVVVINGNGDEAIVIDD